MQPINSNTSKELSTELLNRVGEKLDEQAHRKLLRALEIAETAHSGQARDDGTPYLSHPLRVALSLVKELDVWDSDLLCVALLHDVLEDAPELTSTVIGEFGLKVEGMVRALTKPHAPEMTRAEINRRYFSRLSKADEDCKLVKLIDKLDNVRDAVNSPDLPKRQRTATEAKEFYLSLAESLSNAGHRKKLLDLLNSALELLTDTEIGNDTVGEPPTHSDSCVGQK